MGSLGSVASCICGETAATQVAIIQVDGSLCYLIKKPGMAEHVVKPVPDRMPILVRHPSAGGRLVAVGYDTVLWADI